MTESELLGISTSTGQQAKPPWSSSPEELSEFIDHHGSVYDPGNDISYTDPGPFADPVSHSKSDPLYRVHTYHTKVPPKGIVEYIEHYTEPGSMVLDPFCGSGMTGVACLMTGRHVVLNDLSPAATHIAYNYCEPMNADSLTKQWASIREKVSDEFEWLYGTKCLKCGGAAKIQSVVWSDVFECLECRGELILWNSAIVREYSSGIYDPPLSTDAMPNLPVWAPIVVETAGTKPGALGESVKRKKGDVVEQFPCHHCGARWKKTQLRLLRTEPVLTRADCQQCKSGKQSYATTVEEKARIKEIDQSNIPYWVPDGPFSSEREMWRGGHRNLGIDNVKDFWTIRNLRSLGSLFSAISTVEDDREKLLLGFAVTACMHRSARTTRFKGGAGSDPLMGTLYVGSFTVENNLLGMIDRRIKNIGDTLPTIRFTGTSSSDCTGGSAVVTQHAGQRLPLPDACIDYVFTDPPFGSNLFYSDLNLLWESWLGYLTDDTYEAVWNKSKKKAQGGKSVQDYKDLMKDAFIEMRRVLKPKRWASVVFHNSDDKIWDAIREAAEEAGFNIRNAQAFDKKQKTFKGIRGDKGLERVSNLDIVLNLYNPSTDGPKRHEQLGEEMAVLDEVVVPVTESGNSFTVNDADIRESIASRIEQYLRAIDVYEESQHDPKLDPRGIQAIHSNIIQAVINQDHPTTGVSLQRVEGVLREFFKEIAARWYLMDDQIDSNGQVIPFGETDVSGVVANWNQVFNGASQSGKKISDEHATISWIRTTLSNGPELHSTIKDQHKLAFPAVKLDKDLDQILEENFSYDPRRKRWRLPTSEQLAEKGQLKAKLLERRANDVLDGSLSGLSDENLGNLIDQCFESGLFKLTTELYLMVGQDILTKERQQDLARKVRVSRYR